LQRFRQSSFGGQPLQLGAPVVENGEQVGEQLVGLVFDPVKDVGDVLELAVGGTTARIAST